MGKEIWKDIVGYEGLYQVSNLGRVKSLERTVTIGFGNKKHLEEKIMSFSTRSGYSIIVLKKNGTKASKQVHRLVAEAFIPKEDDKNIVNHKDFDRKNNVVENLEWCTQKENIRHSVDRMKHPKTRTQTNTGHQYISRRNNYYRVTIEGKEKNFKSLDEAIKYRDEKMVGSE